MTDSDTLPPRYRDPRPLGRGGMGEIFLARDEELGREVAVKVLAERYAQDLSLRARFKREALAAARLSGNPNIVTIFDVEEHRGRPLIVMEYLPGGTLQERARSTGSCPPGQVVSWLEDAASALDAAHEAGIVHRDVKPGNLLLDARGRVQVADFGIASASGLDSFTQTGTILGTAGYLSPEQARGERATAASDRYALAVVAWELLVGKRPFEAETPTAEAAAHVTAPIPSVHRANPSVPASFDPVLSRALAKDPASRYPTAAEFVGDLRRALHDDAGDTGWIVPVQRGGAPTRIAAPAVRRRTWVPALALLLAGGIGAAVLASRGGDAGPVAQPKPKTIIRTVTGAGTTLRETVTAEPPAPATTEPAVPTTAPPTTAPSTTAPPTTAITTTAPAPSTASGAALNDAGYARMGGGDYAGALPLLEQAVAKLSGTGSTTEAYADYNLAYTRYALGQCTEVLALLDRSESIQGARGPITSLRARARKTC